MNSTVKHTLIVIATLIGVCLGPCCVLGLVGFITERMARL